MKSLSNKHLVVTRALHQAEELAAPLRALGGDVILLPLIAIAPPLDPEPLRIAAHALQQYDWIIFTSANAIDAFVSELNVTDLHALHPRVAVVGAATHEAAASHGFPVALVPQRYVTESLLDAFASENLAGARILIPRAEVARDLVPDELRRRGAHVDVVTAYRNIVPPEARAQVIALFHSSSPDWILFASGSAVDNFAQLAPVPLPASIRFASIGPITSQAIRRHGWTVHAEAEPHTVNGLVQAVLAAAG